MRRVLTLLTALATTLALSPVSPARADDTVVVHGFDFPSKYEDFESAGFFGRNCDNPQQFMNEAAPLYIDYTDDVVPLGERMDGFDLSGGEALGPGGFTLTPSTSVLEMRLKPEGGSATGLLLAAYFAPNDFDGYWLGTSEIAEEGSEWRTVDGAGASYTWLRYENQTASFTPAGTDTLAQFVTLHGGDGSSETFAGAYLGILFGCNGNRFWFDGLRVGPPGDITTYDFEGITTVALADATKKTITAGQRTTLQGAPDPDASRFASLELTLEARPFGQDGFSAVGTATSTDEGELVWAELNQRPKVRTDYRWVIADTAQIEGSVSDTVTVQVRTAVTAKIVDDTLRKGDPLVVKGSTTPKQGGVKTTLQRYVGGGWSNIESGHTKADGSYQLSHKVTSKGTWKVRVLVAATPANLAGTSPARKAAVK